MAVTKTYNDVTSAIFDLFRNSLSAYRVTLPEGTTGSVEIRQGPINIDLEFTWNEGAKTLQLGIEDKSFGLWPDAVWNYFTRVITNGIPESPDPE